MSERRTVRNMEIVLIRHGATAGNIEKRYIGTTDEPLCLSLIHIYGITVAVYKMV